MANLTGLPTLFSVSTRVVIDSLQTTSNHSHSIVNETLIKLILLVILFEKLGDTIVYTMFKNTTLLWIFKAPITNIEVILNLAGRS